MKYEANFTIMEKTTKTKKVPALTATKKIVHKAVKAKKEKKTPKTVEDVKVYNQAGKEVSDLKLPENIFGLHFNADLVHQVVRSMISDSRVIYAHTKMRGEVRGGGKKPWKQKGTGRARHGSSRSPIWVGGGITHGPNNLKNYSKKINRKMKTKALYVILSKKLRDGELIFVDSFEIKTPKTVEAIAILKSLAKVKAYSDLFTKKNNSAIIAINGKKPSLEKSFANIGNVTVDEVRNINPVDLMNTKYLIIENPTESIKFLEAKMAK